MEGRSKVLIYGCGAMGSGIACCAALAGEEVLLYDLDRETMQKGLARVRENLAELCRHQLCTQAQADHAVTLVAAAEGFESACSQTKLVIEAVFEKLELKQEIFAKLDAQLPPEVPLLSNTSGLRITDIAKNVRHPQRTLTTHFWLPANLIPLVEVVIGDHSSPKLAEEIKRLLTGWGKSPVIVKKDYPGQLANRILQAMIREAVNIVEMGLASAEDVDTAIKMGMALRFPVWGPLEHVDAVGFDICESVQNTVLPEISGRKDASPLFADMREKGQLGYKTGRGFYDWSQKDMDAMIKRRNDFIVYALKKI